MLEQFEKPPKINFLEWLSRYIPLILLLGYES